MSLKTGNEYIASIEELGLEDNRSLFRVRSSLTGEEINRFNHLHQSTADLTNTVMMQRTCGNLLGCCFQRCVGLEAANAAFSVTYECDQAYGTHYHQPSAS